MGDNISELNEKNFDKFVSEGSCIVDFWAEWCGPCKMLAPELEKFAKEHKGKIKVGKVNVENEQGLAERFMIMSIPALLFFKNGEQVEQTAGAITKEEVEKISKERF